MSGRTRVLLVDSDEEIVSTLRQILSEKTNYEVHTAASYFAAGFECERTRPHVMLIDLHMGDGDPQQIVKFIRRCDELQITRVIAMSSKLTDGQAAQLTHNGFDSALKKPFSVRQAIEVIEKAHAVVY
jgi:DNA-binding response OmpR family regulator